MGLGEVTSYCLEVNTTQAVQICQVSLNNRAPARQVVNEGMTDASLPIATYRHVDSARPGSSTEFLDPGCEVIKRP
jgi:hypothetical protein